MKLKPRPKKKDLQANDLTEREVDAWISTNKDAIERDLTAARKSLRNGEGRPWNFTKFIAKARKRLPAKRK